MAHFLEKERSATIDMKSSPKFQTHNLSSTRVLPLPLDHGFSRNVRPLVRHV